MGMSTHVMGYKAPDDKWDQMKAVYDACMAAKIEVPSNVMEFFDHMKPDPAGVEIDLLREWPDCVIEYNASSRNGYEIIVDQIPDDVTSIRVYNSY